MRFAFHRKFAKDRIELVNDAKLYASADSYWGTLYIGASPEVNDTSSAIIVSQAACTPSSYNGITDSVTLDSVDETEWTLKTGAASGKYAFTVEQTAGAGHKQAKI